MPWVMTPDVNVLVAVARSDHPHHGAAREWLATTLGRANVGSVVTLMPMVVASALRLLTSSRIFQQPTPIGDAVGFVDALLALPGVRLADLGPEWPRLRQLCLDKQLSGNALPDAWLAAAAGQHGEHVVTFDRGFRKLLPRGQLTVLSPLAA